MYGIEELIHLWVAEGFVDSCNMSKRMEDIGRDYFNGWSLFHSFNKFRMDIPMLCMISFMIWHSHSRNKTASDWKMVLQRLKKLRVLYLSLYNKSKLPESIGELKHLRYLNIIRSLVSELPRSLCTLYHLQFLQFSDKLHSLPEVHCNLSNLRHLGMYVDIWAQYTNQIGKFLT
uniref:NB-ARC domain-containing protein n=1 Tax=Aegilops tauschii subsp. strangulata TaxID=200361 RepID=A0A453DFW9_AEGTS